MFELILIIGFVSIIALFVIMLEIGTKPDNEPEYLEDIAN